MRERILADFRYTAADGGKPEGMRIQMEARMLTASRNLPISLLDNVVELMRSAERHI